MRSSLARALTGTVATVGLLAVGATAAVAHDTHTVRSGDTLSSVAAQYDSVASWRDLARANADTVTDPNVIRIGQELVLPGGSTVASAPAEPAEPDTHTVVRGDTLSSIAAQYAGVSSWRELAAANADIIPNPNLIQVGQELALSGTASPATSSTRTPDPAPATTSGKVPLSTWDRLAQCESSGDWSINTGNGYYGGLQFALRSWKWVGGSGMPHHASKAEQIARAEILLERQGWSRGWPACSRKLGLR